MPCRRPSSLRAFTALYPFYRLSPILVGRSDPGWLLTLAAAAMLVLWLAHLVTARGLGNGVVLLLTTDILAQWPAAVQAQWHALRAIPDPLHQGLRVPLFILAVLVLAIILVTARRKVELERIAGGRADIGPAPVLPLRINPVGTMPVLVAQSLLGFGTLAFSTNYMNDLSPVSGIAFCLLVATVRLSLRRRHIQSARRGRAPCNATASGSGRPPPGRTPHAVCAPLLTASWFQASWGSAPWDSRPGSL